MVRPLTKVFSVAVFLLFLLTVSAQVEAYGSLNPIVNNLLEKSAESEKETGSTNDKLGMDLATINIRWSKKTWVLGDYVTFVMKGKHIAEAIANIDLSPFRQHFVIDDITQGSDFIRIKLYPLQAGKFIVKGQRTGNVDIPDYEVEIKPNPEVVIEWQSPSGSIVGQQLVSWLAHVEVDNPAFKVRYLLPEHTNNADLQTYISEQSVFSTENEAQNLTGISANNSTNPSFNIERKQHNLVAVYEMPSPLQAKNLLLHSPVVEVKNTTHKRWKFFAPPVALTVQALPSFLPLSVTVGEVDWHIDELDYIYETGELNQWHWQIYAKNVTTDYLQSLVYQQLRELQIDGVQFLSETIQTRQQFTTEGLHSQVSVTVPFRVKTSGRLSFPEMNLRYFSPQSGLVEQKVWLNQSVIVLPNGLLWAVKWVLLVMLLVVSFIALWTLKGSIARWQFKRQLMQITNENGDALTTSHAIWKAMQTWYEQQPAWQINFQALLKRPASFQAHRKEVFVSLKNQPESELCPQSLAQWQSWYESFNTKSVDLSAVITIMNRLYYQSKSESDLNKGTEQVLKGHVKAWLANWP